MKTAGKSEKTNLMFRLVKLILLPFAIVIWPFRKSWEAVDRHFVSYLLGRVTRDRRRIYSIRFIWYGDSVYLHPMIWGSLLLSGLTVAGILSTGWALCVWFAALFVCYVTILYNLDIFRCGILGIGIVAFFGMAHVSMVEFAWNPLSSLWRHVQTLEASVTPGFFIAAAYVFLALISLEVVWAWLFHRVEIDESYVYEHQFMVSTTREPIFARGLKRETRDILELILLGAGDIQHRTRKGYKSFRNVPFASLWLGTAIDSLLDFRRRVEPETTSTTDDEATLVRMSDANRDHPDADPGGNEDMDMEMDVDDVDGDGSV